MTHSTARKPSIIGLRKEQIWVRLAETRAEVRQAQNLRQRCFFPNADPDGLDEDRFDAIADHLIAIDTGSNAVIGTYRFMLAEHAKQAGGFYSASEFDLSFLKQLNGNTLELGRSCVDPAYRKSGVATLLWLGCGGYVAAHNIKNLFGCASFPGTDPLPFEQALSYLYYEMPPPETISVGALTPEKLNTDRIAKNRLDRKTALEQMPALIKGYSKMGGWFGQEAAVDEHFKCIDVLLCVTAATAPPRYHKRFKRPEFVIKPPH